MGVAMGLSACLLHLTQQGMQFRLQPSLTMGDIYTSISLIPNRAYQSFSEILVLLSCYFQHCMMAGLGISSRTSTFEN